MSRFRIKKQPLIAVAGIVWLLAGLNVAILGVRAAIDVRARKRDVRIHKPTF